MAHFSRMDYGLRFSAVRWATAIIVSRNPYELKRAPKEKNNVIQAALILGKLWQKKIFLNFYRSKLSLGYHSCHHFFYQARKLEVIPAAKILRIISVLWVYCLFIFLLLRIYLFIHIYRYLFIYFLRLNFKAPQNIFV